MTYRISAAALAAIVVAGAAFAQAPPAMHPDKAEMQRHAVDMCKDRLAHATGELAYLEAKLALTEAQKPLFERWKKVKLAAAKSADCAPPPDGEPAIVEHLKQEEKLLRQRLDELKAELPALEALVASLSEDQKLAFAPPHRPHGDRPGPDHRDPGDNEHGTPPPPPEH